MQKDNTTKRISKRWYVTGAAALAVVAMGAAGLVAHNMQSNPSDAVVTTAASQPKSAFAAVSTADVHKDFVSTPDYIASHMNHKYVGNGQLKMRDGLTVTITRADGKKLPNATLQKLWSEDKNHDGISDNADAYAGQSQILAGLYEVSPNSKYYVARIGASIDGAKLTDAEGAKNDDFGHLRKDIIIDRVNGLAYVPKTYTNKAKHQYNDSRVQLLYTLDDAYTSDSNIAVKVDNSGVKGNVMKSGEANPQSIAVSTKVQLAGDKATMSKINDKTIDSVTVNGIKMDNGNTAWSYDQKTGTLNIDMSPSVINDVEIKLSDSVSKQADHAAAVMYSLFKPKAAQAAGIPIIGQFGFTGNPTVGQTIHTQGPNNYGANAGDTGTRGWGLSDGQSGNFGQCDSVGGGPRDVASCGLAKATVAGGNINTADLTPLDSPNGDAGFFTFHAGVTAGTYDGVKVPNLSLALRCAHVGVTADFKLDAGANSAGKVLPNQIMRVFSVDNATHQAIIGVAVPTSETQSAAGMYGITFQPPTGWLTLHKASGNTNFTDGNNAYNISGIKYGVYKTQADAQANKNAIHTFTTDGSGNTDKFEANAGTYYVREISSNTGYVPSSQVYTAVIKSAQTTTI